MNCSSWKARLSASVAVGIVLNWLLAAGAMAGTPIRVIFDTDLGSDVDDAGTVAVLHALADRDEVEILAMGLSVKHPWSAPCLDAFNTYYGRPDIPIGVVKGTGVDDGSKYAKTIAEEFPHDLKSADDAPDIVALYRETLAKAPDDGVVLVTVGFLTNAANLLASKGDKLSELSGTELVGKKVHSWVCMGGGFPGGREYNLMRDAAATRQAIDDWPRPIVFSGFEIGESIQTGASLNALPATNPIRRAYEVFNGLNNRSSWDQTAVLFAARGLDGGLAEFWDVHEHGKNEVFSDGRNQWHDATEGRHSYLVRKMPSEQVAKAIEVLMMQSPRKPSP